MTAPSNANTSGLAEKPAHMSDELFEVWRKIKPGPDYAPYRIEAAEKEARGANDRAASAQARIAELETERDAEKGRADKLSAAISWLDYPFIDNRAAEPELRSRVGFMMKDAEPYRAALQQEG